MLLLHRWLEFRLAPWSARGAGLDKLPTGWETCITNNTNIVWTLRDKAHLDIVRNLKKSFHMRLAPHIIHPET